MQIRQDPISKLWCREDGAVLMPPAGRKFKTFRWVFGSKNCYGYKQVRFQGKCYRVHRAVCQAFHGPAPEDKPEVDHINRIKDDNRPENLRWVSREENVANADRVDRSVGEYGTRACEDKTAYMRAYREKHREEYAARSRAYRERHKSEAA